MSRNGRQMNAISLRRVFMAKSGCDAVYAEKHTKHISRTATRKQEPHIVRAAMDTGGQTMAELVSVLRGIEIHLLFISIWLCLMLFFKDMGGKG